MTHFKKYQLGLIYGILVIISIIVIFPLFWLVVTSFKTYSEIYHFPLSYYPHQPTLEHYHKIMDLNFPRYFFNSILVGIGTMLIAIFIALLPAYAFARFHFSLKKPLLVSILMTQMFPMVSFVIPLFRILKSFHLINTYTGIIISYLPFISPVVVWILVNFFESVPVEFEEAAMVDGCTHIQAFGRIILPLILPGLASTGIYVFLFAWAELMFALTFLTSASMQTVSVFLTLFVG
ncbi:carbohydrate ABC transporter permease, partial [Candidatus Aerophobetes bacterium]|nr:carbohydrate ABC transporter permease [Candidatus Aerophobetes bacterium]